MIHLAFSLAPALLEPYGKSRSDRTAGITRCGLNIAVLEWRTAVDLPVGDRIVGAAAGKHEIVGGKLLMQMGEEVKERFLVHGLDGTRQILVPLLQRLTGLASLAKELLNF